MASSAMFDVPHQDVAPDWQRGDHGHPAGTVNQPSRFSPEALDAVLQTSLRQHPDAWVVAIARSGQFTTMPEAVPLVGQRVIEGPFSALDLVTAEDRSIVVDAWRQTLEEGVSVLTVHPLNASDRVVGVRFVDATHRYGVFIGMFIGFPGDGAPEAGNAALLIPRTSVIRKSEVGVITSVDDALSALLGWTADELLGKRTLELVHPDDQERAIANWVDMVGRPGAARRVRLRHRHKDGSWRWLEVTNTNHLADPDPHVLAEMVDVTDEVTALEALRANEQLLRRLTDALPVGVLQVGVDGSVNYCNERLTAIVGVKDASTVEGEFATVEAADRERVHEAVTKVLLAGQDTDVEVSFCPPMEKVRRCVMNLRALTSERGEVTGAIICLSDITEDVNLREELQRRVRFDPLTACLNHASILAELSQRLGNPAPGRWTAVLFVDLDDFKAVNDRHGHVAGDRLLKHVASRLRRVARDSDVVGRLGGDEFLMVLETDPDEAAVRQAAACVESALNAPIRLGGAWTVTRASIGIAYAAAGELVDADALVAAADQAMYASKRRGSGPPVVASPGR